MLEQASEWWSANGADFVLLILVAFIAHRVDGIHSSLKGMNFMMRRENFGDD